MQRAWRSVSGLRLFEWIRFQNTFEGRIGGVWGRGKDNNISIVELGPGYDLPKFKPESNNSGRKPRTSHGTPSSPHSFKLVTADRDLASRFYISLYHRLGLPFYTGSLEPGGTLGWPLGAEAQPGEGNDLK